ncbi:MAG: T9SS type A sorting domain-containing protein, partial [Bacteroidetes bacterium]|nr:T9SS type A sorting domain-containing protein [Bacteroidota bacterium]
TNNFSIANSIFWNNKRDSNFSDIFIDGASPTVASSILQDTSTTFPVLTQNPEFVDLLGPDSIAGSGDENLELQEISPAINGGDNSFVSTAFDLAGNTRIQKDTIDLGAYESPYNSFQDTTTSIISPGLSAIPIRIFPNPATAEINLGYQQHKAGSRTLSVMNSTGQIVLIRREFQHSGYHVEQLDIDKLSAGSYFIVLECAGRVGMQKFLKKK